jgi:hypothetical protein
LTDDHFKVPLQLTITPSKYFLRIFTFAGRPPFFPFARQAAVFLSDFANPPLRPIIEAALLTASIALLLAGVAGRRRGLLFVKLYLGIDAELLQLMPHCCGTAY